MTTIHRFEASALPVNAYLVETDEGIVVIDSTLTVSDGHSLRERIEDTDKPLSGVLVTHAHPDHYGGLVELARGLSDLPIYAAEGVAEVIRRDDPVKEQILRPMFGDEWPRERTFPNRTVSDGEMVEIAGVRFRLMDLGPGESPHDSAWVLEADVSGGAPRVFCGDLVYDHMHGYLADGYYEAWLANIERARSVFPADTIFYMGHGKPGGADLLDWQEGYIHTFLDAVQNAGDTEDEAATQSVTAAMKDYLPSDDLLFLMQLSVPAVRQQINAAS
jgi:glyoxylase-like metal-dependent hydrolase (beta-lactamase superfamily II)